MIKPLNDFVLLKRANINDKTKTGIILSSNSENNFATVVAIGDKCDIEIKVSQKVFFIEEKINKIMYNGEEYIIIKYNDITSIIE